MRISRSEPFDDPLGYGLAVGVTALVTGANALMAPYVAHTNLVMVYLLGVTFVATRCSPGPAVAASFLSVAAFDFCFVHPQGTFAVSDVQYLFTFGVMLVVSLLISSLAFRLREQSKARGDAALHAHLEKTRGDLLSAVSHDLRTPLASIEGSAGALLQQPELTEQSAQLALTIQGESVRMARLIRNLLDMTRMQGRIDLELDWYGLDELFANAILRTESMFDAPVQLEASPDAPLAWVDGVLMEQVFVNLLENASRHAGRSAQVWVKIRLAREMLVVEVRDDGPGIGSMTGIFERFQGAKNGGFGLGLAICRAAIEAHQGKIWADSPTGRGARFVIELPVRKEAAVG